MNHLEERIDNQEVPGCLDSGFQCACLSLVCQQLAEGLQRQFPQTPALQEKPFLERRFSHWESRE